MINTQQLIVFMPLFNVQLPGNAQAFFNQIFKIAAFDIIEVEPAVNFILNLEPTGPYNSNFNALGFQSPLLLAFLLYFVMIGVLFVTNQLARKSKRAAAISNKLYDTLFYNSFISIMIESYSIMSCCVLINMRYVRFETWGQTIQTAFAFVGLSLLLLFPTLLVLLAYCSWDQPHTKKRFQPFFEELDMRKGPKVIIHPLYFLVRRLLMSVLIVYVENFLIAQIFLKAMMIIVAVILIGHVEALHTPTRRNFEFFNEIIIMMVLYTMICFSPFVPDLKARYDVGFFCIFLVSLHLGINLGLMLRDTFKQLLFKYRIWQAKRKLVRERFVKSQKFADAKVGQKFRRRLRAAKRKGQIIEDLTDYQGNVQVEQQKAKDAELLFGSPQLEGELVAQESVCFGNSIGMQTPGLKEKSSLARMKTGVTVSRGQNITHLQQTIDELEPVSAILNYSDQPGESYHDEKPMKGSTSQKMSQKCKQEHRREGSNWEEYLNSLELKYAADQDLEQLENKPKTIRKKTVFNDSDHQRDQVTKSELVTSQKTKKYYAEGQHRVNHQVIKLLDHDQMAKRTKIRQAKTTVNDLSRTVTRNSKYAAFKSPDGQETDEEVQSAQMQKNTQINQLDEAIIQRIINEHDNQAVNRLDQKAIQRIISRFDREK